MVKNFSIVNFSVLKGEHICGLYVHADPCHTDGPQKRLQGTHEAQAEAENQEDEQSRVHGVTHTETHPDTPLQSFMTNYVLFILILSLNASL